jgi:hypothetical protein
METRKYSSKIDDIKVRPTDRVPLQGRYLY